MAIRSYFSASFLTCFVAFFCVIGGLGCSDYTIEISGKEGVPTDLVLRSWAPAAVVSVEAEAATYTGTFLIDTGAPITMMDTDSFPAIAKGAYVFGVNAFSLNFKGVKTAAFDVFPAPIDPEFGFDGILGGDILSYFSVALDYQKPRIWLRRKSLNEFPEALDASRLGKTRILPARVLGGGTLHIPCEHWCGAIDFGPSRILVALFLENDASPHWFIVDTGATMSVLRSSVYDALGSDARPLLNGISVATAAGIQSAFLTRMRSVYFAMGEIGNLEVLILPDNTLFDTADAELGVEISGLLGGNFLRHFFVELNYIDEVVKLSLFKNKSHIPQNEFIGLGCQFVRGNGGWRIGDVYENTHAESLGLRRGEIVVSLDGQAVDGLSLPELEALKRTFVMGEFVRVERLNRETVDVLVEDLLPRFE